ncbi:5-formyltetrahydrofolate cyclo-ligase [Methanofollis aquaemaris]|uniref:5-formyltetrahydrofolate cyclo-ligase n=1 Tax=Methanofollis aquaemaris TaxID=126734 RepID=A0A8A3S2D2_9EURY|nr:5-formyltetrahydrofolate cyclo-ligase [Methanofollis aquaemaris]QSZ66089.1 5-formyltetrahydrofolate cyclo-ligase [Methanofollis aquaemaris]
MSAVPEPERQAVEKKALREQVKARRAALSTDEIREKSGAISERLLPLLDGAGTVMLYASKPPEVETAGLIDALIAEGRRVVLPIIEKETHTLRLSSIPDRSVLVESTFHVPEPIGHEVPVDPADLDAVVVPMVGFDRVCNRLGYGAGYYDRFLEANPGLTVIGVAFSCQELPSIPSEPFDRRMDRIITEGECIACPP